MSCWFIEAERVGGRDGVEGNDRVSGLRWTRKDLQGALTSERHDEDHHPSGDRKVSFHRNTGPTRRFPPCRDGQWPPQSIAVGEMTTLSSRWLSVPEPPSSLIPHAFVAFQICLDTFPVAGSITDTVVMPNGIVRGDSNCGQRVQRKCFFIENVLPPVKRNIDVEVVVMDRFRRKFSAPTTAAVRRLEFPSALPEHVSSRRSP